MKVQPGFTLKEVAESYVIVPTGANIIDFSAMITINETGAFLWNNLQEDITEEALVDALTAEYDVDRTTAETDVKEFIDVLKSKKVLN